MPVHKRPTGSASGVSTSAKRAKVLPEVSAAAAFSFLQQTKGLSSWTVRDLARALKLTTSEAQRVATALEMQGYAKVYKGSEWVTTLAGEGVSQAKPPRFLPARVEQALAGLRTRIATINKDAEAPFRITAAVAFGDFLGPRRRVQAANVGIRLARKDPDQREPAEREFLSQLGAQSPLLRIATYQQWMSARTHRSVL